MTRRGKEDITKCIVKSVSVYALSKPTSAERGRTVKFRKDGRSLLTFHRTNVAGR